MLLFILQSTSLPPMAELKWYLNLNRLLVIQRDSTLLLFSYAFQKGGKEENLGDDILAGGALSGIESLLAEITKSQGGINEIDHGDKKVSSHYAQDATFILFTISKAAEFHDRLARFSFLLYQKYGSFIKDWEGNQAAFQDAETLVKEVFMR